MLQRIFHFIFENPVKKLRDVTETICHHCSYSHPGLKLYQTAERMHVSVESTSLLLIAIKNNWLAQTQRH